MAFGKIKYNNQVLYQVHCINADITATYTAFTTSLIKRRYVHHKEIDHPNNRFYNTPMSEYIRANGGWKNWAVTQIKNLSHCSTFEECLAEQAENMKTKDSYLNLIRPSRREKLVV